MTMRLAWFLCGWLFAQFALAQDAYPRRAVRLVVPFAAGGPTDIAGRLVARGLADRLGQPVAVENKTGAGAVSGTDFVAKSAPDGYTVLLGTIAHTIAPALYRTLPFDPVKDFAPVGLIARAPLVLVVKPSLGVSDVNGLIRLMKESPGKFTYGSAGNGAVDHLSSGWFESRAGVKGLHVPYRGSAPAIQDLVAGRLDFMITTFFAVLPHIQSGALKPLGAASAERLTLLPSVPTMAQAGLPDFEVSTWYSLLFPAGTPAPVVARMNQALVGTLADADLRKRFLELGAEVASDTAPEQLAKFIGVEIRRWSAVVDSAGVEKQ